MYEEPVTLSAPVPAVTTVEPYESVVSDALAAHRVVLNRALRQLTAQSTVLAAVAARLIAVLGSGSKVLVAGNGGSASEAQHLAAELVGRFKRERAPYAVLALTADTSTLTAVANDYGYDQVFARQVAALGQPGDVLVAFSTSGESENIVAAATAARQREMGVIALTADRPSRLEQLADLTIRAPVAETATAQELHTVIIHVLCSIVESELSTTGGEVE